MISQSLSSFIVKKPRRNGRIDTFGRRRLGKGLIRSLRVPIEFKRKLMLRDLMRHPPVKGVGHKVLTKRDSMVRGVEKGRRMRDRGYVLDDGGGTRLWVTRDSESRNQTKKSTRSSSLHNGTETSWLGNRNGIEYTNLSERKSYSKKDPPTTSVSCSQGTKYLIEWLVGTIL